MQGGHFDISDRLFYSIQETFKSVCEEVSDVRELIPEFFYMPEMFLNINKENFGACKSNNMIVNDVFLPEWAKSNPYNFIVLHR